MNGPIMQRFCRVGTDAVNDWRSLADAVGARGPGGAIVVAGAHEVALSREANPALAQRRPRRHIIDDTIAIVVDAIAGLRCWHAAAAGAYTIRRADLTHRARIHRPTLRWCSTALSHDALTAIRTQRRPRRLFVNGVIAIVVDAIANFRSRHATALHARTIRRTDLAGWARIHRAAGRRIAAALTHDALATVRAQRRPRRHLVDRIIAIVVDAIADFRCRHAAARTADTIRRADLTGWTWRKHRAALLRRVVALTHDALTAVRTERHRPRILLVDLTIAIVVGPIADFWQVHATSRHAPAPRRAHLPRRTRRTIRSTHLRIAAAHSIDAHRTIRTNGPGAIVDDAIAIVIDAIAGFLRAGRAARADSTDAKPIRTTIGIAHARSVADALAHETHAAIRTQQNGRIVLLVNGPVAIVIDTIAYLGRSRTHRNAHTRRITHRAWRTRWRVRTTLLGRNAMIALSAICSAHPNPRRRVTCAARRITRIRIRIRHAYLSRSATRWRAAQGTRNSITRRLSRARTNTIHAHLPHGALRVGHARRRIATVATSPITIAANDDGVDTRG